MKLARIAVPDLVSNSYFPAIAAIALDLFAKEGLDAELRLIFPNFKAYEALRDGEVDFVAGPAHVVLAGVSRMARRQALGRAGARNLLATGHALRSRMQHRATSVPCVDVRSPPPRWWKRR